jgi:hypothetical protein
MVSIGWKIKAERIRVPDTEQIYALVSQSTNMK